MTRRGSPFSAVDQQIADRVLNDPMATLAFVKDVALLLKDCAIDARIARRDKWVIAAVAAYLLSPIDLIPDVIPVLGQMDDLGVAIWGVRQLLRSAGPQIVRDLWRGSDDGLALVLGAAGMQMRGAGYHKAHGGPHGDGQRTGGA